MSLEHIVMLEKVSTFPLADDRLSTNLIKLKKKKTRL